MAQLTARPRGQPPALRRTRTELAKAEAEAFRLSVRAAGIRHDGAAAAAALYRAKSGGRDRVEAEAL